MLSPHITHDGALEQTRAEQDQTAREVAQAYWTVGLAGGLVTVTALFLWGFAGNSVYFDRLAAGIASCFGL